ncbi:InlB B-repeat-containing protein [Bifidobacterium sp. ESL0732]|nr:InlB B-repeat-containing protein [Bifidobacterium sp. ESL0732]WEV64372.1 InlB B-repeat-containing protein [Bifidobacterium sp. ESL0732]
MFSSLRFVKLPRLGRLNSDAFNAWNGTSVVEETGWHQVKWESENSNWTGYPGVSGLPADSQTWVGRPYTVSFDMNQGTGTAPAPVSGGWPDNPNVTLPAVSGLRRSGFRIGGWNSNSTATGTGYALGQSVSLPLSVGDDPTLYAVWKPLPKAGLSDVVTPTQPTGEAGKVKLDGTVEQDAGIAALQSGDKGEISLMHSGKETSTVLGDGTVADEADTSLDTTGYTWRSSFPVADLAAMDAKGLGIPYTFRMRVNTTADGSSEYAFSTKTLDVVAPVVTGAKVGLGSSGSGGRLKLSTKSSGNAAQAVVDTGAMVTVEWYSHDGTAPLSVPASGPTTVDANGDWAIDVPAGVPDGSYAKIIVKDTAGNSSQGVNSDGQLVRLQFPATAMPMTGVNWRSQVRRYLPLALATLVAALVAAAVSRVRRRSAMGLR